MDPVDRRRLRRSSWSLMCGARVRAITAAELLGDVSPRGLSQAGQAAWHPAAAPCARGQCANRWTPAVAARMGVVALVDDDAVQLATAGATTSTGVGGALLGHPGAGKARRGRRGSDLVVAVPVAPLAQHRGGSLPERVLEVRRRRSADRLVDGLREQLVTAGEDPLVDAAAVAPAGQCLGGRHQLLVHAGPLPQQVPHRPRSASWASSAAAE